MSDKIWKTTLATFVGAAILGIAGGLLAMHSKQAGLEIRMSFAETRSDTAAEMITQTHTTVVRLDTMMKNFGDQLKEIKEAQKALPGRLLSLIEEKIEEDALSERLLAHTEEKDK